MVVVFISSYLTIVDTGYVVGAQSICLLYLSFNPDWEIDGFRAQGCFRQVCVPDYFTQSVDSDVLNFRLLRKDAGFHFYEDKLLLRSWGLYTKVGLMVHYRGYLGCFIGRILIFLHIIFAPDRLLIPCFPILFLQVIHRMVGA